MHETYYGDKSYETDNGIQSGGKASYNIDTNPKAWDDGAEMKTVSRSDVNAPRGMKMILGVNLPENTRGHQAGLKCR